MVEVPDFTQIEGFEWDQANINKNWTKHNVSTEECEQVFRNYPLRTSPDQEHSRSESRFQALGRTDDRRPLFLSFTIRNHKIRIISARDQSRKERNIYEKNT